MMGTIKEKATDFFSSAIESGTETACEVFLDGIVGTVAPGVVSGMLAYKQKRQERMYELFLEEIKKDIYKINENLTRLNTTSLLNFRDKYFGMISDYVFEETQEEKIKFLENGLVNLSGMDDVGEDFVLSYYDTFMQVRMLDLIILKNYHDILWGAGRRYYEMMQEIGIDWDQYYATRAKLERLGLVTTKRTENEDNLYKNMMDIQEYLKGLEKGKPPRLKTFRKIEETDTFKISKYGRAFLEFFSESSTEDRQDI